MSLSVGQLIRQPSMLRTVHLLVKQLVKYAAKAAFFAKMDTGSERGTMSLHLLGCGLFAIPAVIAIGYNFHHTDWWHARICWRQSKSFFFASLLYPPKLRNKIFVLYSFAREADDMIDDCSGEVQIQNMATLETVVSRFYAKGFNQNEAQIMQENSSGLSPAAFARRRKIFQDFGNLVRRHRIPRWTISLLLDGFQYDTMVREVRSERDLLLYCVRVASSIGILCVYLYETKDISEDVLVKATSLGIAFQLTNISRDIVTDARMGRTYVPGTWLCAKAASRDDFLQGVLHNTCHMNEISRELSLELIDFAEAYYDLAWDGISLVPCQAKAAIGAALLIYREIGMVIRQLPYYPERAYVSTWRKFELTIKSFYFILSGTKPNFQSFTRSGVSSNKNLSAEALACCTQLLAPERYSGSTSPRKVLSRLKRAFLKVKGRPKGDKQLSIVSSGQKESD